MKRTSASPTAASMEFELLSALTGKVGSKNVLLPRRQSFFAREPTARAHHAALSFTALVAYKSRNSPGYKILLCKRSEDVAVYRGLFGVIPGGMFQPEISPHEEWNVHHCIIKEFVEEFFSCEFDRGRWNPFYIFYDDADPRWQHATQLYRALKEGICKILYSGVILTMMDLLPQICCVLVIDDAAWFQRQALAMANNFENVSRSDFVRAVKAAKAEFDVDDFETEFLAMHERGMDGPRISGRGVPASLGSLWLGMKALREYSDKRRPATEFMPYLSHFGLPEP